MLENEIYPTDELYFINEEFYTLKAAPRQIDVLWANGWRHFGTQFYRYNFSFYEGRICRVFPLCIRLADFSLSKNKRRILKKNQDLQIVIRPIEITDEKEILFERHKRRFKRGVPFSLYDFLSFDAAIVPCKALEVCVYDRKNLLAASFFDVGETAISGIYAMFAPEETSRSLGIFTMLLEIDFAFKNGKEFYYQGYAYERNSFYDYKKRFRALEKFDWNGNWENFQEEKS
ncbi:MAG: arginine-tRNA-protein transferase [Acidobacteriota bacterium]|nr:arginine-tRNA-protein transferase [Acidobacteriota bacterium]